MENLENIIYNGVIKAPVDERNYTLETLGIPVGSAQIPYEFHIDYKGRIKSQGSINSCVGHAISYVRDYIENQQNGGEYIEFSPGFIYCNRKTTDYQGMGMMIPEALNNLIEFGICTQKSFPINQEYPKITYIMKNQYNKDNLLKEAYPHRINTYCQLKSSDEIKRALMTLGPVICSIYVYEGFTKVKSDGTVPEGYGKFLGLHCVTIIGWKGDYFELLNSYGNSWGDNGKFYLPTSYQFDEAYSITDEIYNVPKPTTYYKVQLGAYSIRTNADQLANEIRSKGVDCCIVIVNNLFKVQCGCFVNKSNADATRDKLISLGYKDAFVITIQK